MGAHHDPGCQCHECWWKRWRADVDQGVEGVPFRALRLRLGLTLGELARELDVSVEELTK